MKHLLVISILLVLMSLSCFSLGGEPPDDTYILEVGQSVTTKEAVSAPSTKESSKNDKISIEELEKELKNIEAFLDVLEKRSADARKAGNNKELASIEDKEEQALGQAKVIRAEIARRKGEASVSSEAPSKPKSPKDLIKERNVPITLVTPVIQVTKVTTKVVYHRVMPGETLSSISNMYYGTPNDYQRIAALNNIDENGIIYQGMQLKVEVGGSARTQTQAPAPVRTVKPKIIQHVVQHGETLMSISRKYFGNASYYMKIAKQNGISNVDGIKVGMRLNIDMGLK